MMKKLERGQPGFHLVGKMTEGRSLPVRVVCDTSQGVVPCHECREQREKAAGLDDRWVWRTGRVPV